MRRATRLAGPARAMRARALALGLFGLVVGLGGSAEAHRGPPFPVAVDRQVGPFRVSVWADPDIGTATFYLGVDAPPRVSDRDPRLQLVVWPKSHRLAPVAASADPQPDGAYVAHVDLDRGELWEVRVDAQGTRGAGQFQFEVEATPPGYGRWDILVYAGPFLLLGFLAIAVVARRHHLMTQESAGVDA